MNPQERANRLRKVQTLTYFVQELAKGLGEKPSALAIRMSPEERLETCRVAGVNPASEETWGMLVLRLSRMEEAKENTDPFAGL